ncbi:single-stranded DNA-binding protein [Corynebacterium hadale]|uniref:Single-stranded DNA-binding protein n=2 Tax=Corynebacterium TaxID=1716 RepID=A0AB36RHF3_9CORY|nr:MULTISPECIES: single-stranded DNA-binding protein [Corynebacterium]MBL7286881.1 single-stranded DNA-binding protein [Corynebacterium godavarianum]MCG7254880.1 single-stranded DNA-binding protein [Corynebacterium hadale]MCG7256376.1 single-stranded DNA-binding protein [Corynebacterium hadale]MCG7266207.1 single-stranded DNA-binding protein [Corynebacterium hadale]PAT06145.1 single-stranded DNA-binding protein [Corynebacterium hadale]
MAQNETPITVVGNLVADPELRFTPSGAAVANFRIASTPRSFNRETNQFEDGEALFLTCNCWRQMAENVAESLTKGMRVIVQGRLRQRSYQTREGENRTVFEVEVDEVGPSIKFATASVTRTPRDGGGQQRRPQQQQAPQQQYQQQPQQAQRPQQQAQPDNDPWNSAPPAGGFGGMDDEPPF